MQCKSYEIYLFVISEFKYMCMFLENVTSLT